MNKSYICHHCEVEFDSLPDEQKAYLEPAGITVVLVRCPGCSKAYSLDIAGNATFIGEATSADEEMLG